MARTKGATATRTYVTIPTYLRHPARRLPRIFRDEWRNIYPDALDDVLGGPKRDVEYDAIILENEHLRLTILPELGGKLWSVFDKNAQQEAVYVPDCIKPGLVARCGAWIPGGMEFNFPIGHHVHSMRPRPCAILESGPQRAVAMMEFPDARTSMRMEVRIVLVAGEARFHIHYMVANPTVLSHRWYMWTNVGMLAHDDWRMFSKARYMVSGGSVLPYPISRQGFDISYYKNRLFSMDSFVVAHREDFFGCYDYRREHGLAHVAPWRELAGKKCFSWGTTYREYDAERVFNDAGEDYLEIQVGVMETQEDFDILAPGEVRCFKGTWIPFRRIGGIEWADERLVFYVRDGKPWLYAAAAIDVEIRIDGKRYRRRLRPAVPTRLPATVRKASRIEIYIDGQLARAFTYPLQGRQEPNGPARVRRQMAQRHREPRTTRQRLEHARLMVKYGSCTKAIQEYRAVLQARPNLHPVRLELADALWHIGDFDGGEAELRGLLRTRYASQARAMLARRKQAEQTFLAPVLAVPEGPARQLALAERLAGYGHFDAAWRIYRKLLRTDGRNPRVHYGAALYYWHVRKDLANAVRHADRALTLRPGDRDLLIELCPLYHAAGKHRRVIKLLTAAPRDVRNLYLCQKFLAKSYFELGWFDRCWAIVSRVRLFNWEGEVAHVDVYTDCAIAMAERALARGDVSSARRLVEAIKHLPANLGVLRRGHGAARVGYWDGLVRSKEDDLSAAREIWRAALQETETEMDLTEHEAGHKAVNWITDEIAYYYGMCAWGLGDKRRLARALRFLESLKESPHRWWALPHDKDFLDGAICELKGDFRRAARFFERCIRKPGDTRLAQLHLAAIRKGRRRGEL